MLVPGPCNLRLAVGKKQKKCLIFHLLIFFFFYANKTVIITQNSCFCYISLLLPFSSFRTRSSYNFHKSVGEELSAACERDLRCLRLVAHGKWLAQDLPKLKLVIYQPNKSIRNQFSTQKGIFSRV